MRDVKVRREELLNTVRANREKHIADYHEAVAGFRRSAIEAARAGCDRLVEYVGEAKNSKELKLPPTILSSLTVPVSHAKSYDQVIRMLEMSTDDIITLRSDEFSCFVMDDWDWKEDFLNVTNSYKERR